MKNTTNRVGLCLFALLIGCTPTPDVAPDTFSEQLKGIDQITIFTDLMKTAGKGLINVNDRNTLFIPTNEAFKHLDIEQKRDYDGATMLAFLASQMTTSPLPSANFKSGVFTTANTKTVRMYAGRAFTQIEDALVETTDLTIGNLTVHLVDRLFNPATLTGHDHNAHASGHAHGGTHEDNMVNHCGTAGPDAATVQEAIAFRKKTSVFLATLPTWGPEAAASRTMPHGYALMGGRNNGLPYIHYFSKDNMEDGKFMDPNAPEGLMYGLTADGVVYPISAVYLTREATAQQLHNLNCLYMFHEHEGLPGIMMHYFHDAYPSTNYGLDHEANPVLVRQMKTK
jgi:hypothetical protein